MGVPSSLPLSAAASLRAGLGVLRHVESTGSTNDDLVQEARQGITAAAVLVADRQTRGRGRLGRSWSNAGELSDVGGQGDAGNAPDASGQSLLVSLRLPGPMTTAHHRRAALSAAAWEAADAALAGSPAAVKVKWPNDLLIESGAVTGKLAGVLAEVVLGDRPVVVVGLGLNIGPVSNMPTAVSLAEAGSVVSRDELLAHLLDVLPSYLADPVRTRNVLRSASATIGRRVRVEQANGNSVTGTARNIDDAGGLVLDVEGQERLINEGDIVHLRHS